MSAVTRTQQLPELKDVNDFGERQRLLSAAHSFDAGAVRGKSVLLFDDLFRSGATMSVVADGIRAAGATRITAHTLTKTRSSR
ncbi:MAG: phosphoribosyltransferase family protein [Archangium sp.]